MLCYSCNDECRARKTQMSRRPIGSTQKVKRGSRTRGTFTIKVGKREHILDIFPPKSEEIRAVTNKETWTVDLKPVHPDNWIRGRSAATRLSALDRSEGRCERCKENPATQIHHANRMKTKRTVLARITSDKDQRGRATAICKECHLEVHHGTWQG